MNIREHYSLKDLTWFKVGGNARYFAKPQNTEDLSSVLQKFPEYKIIGNTSNLLISDYDLDFCVIKLGSHFGKIEQMNETTFKVGASCLDLTLAKSMQNLGISGMEFLGTIPGTFGGNVAMNAGCFGGEIFDLIQSIEIMLPNGKIEILQKNEISYTYRHASLPKNAIILSAIVSGVISTKENVQNKMDELMQKRLEAQPQNVRTGGSTFKNPEGFSAWKLIRDCNAHLIKIGGAEVSEKHANFLINTGNATAQEIFTLGETIRKKVFENSGVMLEWEIKTIGKFEKLF